MLRNAVLAVAALIAVAAVLGAMIDPGVWPTALIAAVLLAGIWFERRRYGELRAPPTSGAWQPTGERFIDDASGRPVTVWFNGTTGERRYVDDAGAD